MRCDEVDEAVELYMAGALPEDDTIRLERHASSCSRCAAAVASWSGVVEGLAASAGDETPPREVRGRVLEQVAAKARVPRSSSIPATGWGPWLATAALLVACAWLGYDGLRLRRSIAALESQLATERTRVAATEQRIAGLQDTAVAQTRAVAVLTAPDVARVDLGGQPVAPAASARAFWSRSHGMVFSASALPPLPPGRVYQLWVVTAAAPVSVGLLEPDASGRAQGVFATSPDIQPLAVAVTLEPAGGVQAPTGEKYLVGVPARRT